MIAHFLKRITLLSFTRLCADGRRMELISRVPFPAVICYLRHFALRPNALQTHSDAPRSVSMPINDKIFVFTLRMPKIELQSFLEAYWLFTTTKKRPVLQHLPPVDTNFVSHRQILAIPLEV